MTRDTTGMTDDQDHLEGQEAAEQPLRNYEPALDPDTPAPGISFLYPMIGKDGQKPRDIHITVPNEPGASWEKSKARAFRFYDALRSAEDWVEENGIIDHLVAEDEADDWRHARAINNYAAGIIQNNYLRVYLRRALSDSEETAFLERLAEALEAKNTDDLLDRLFQLSEVTAKHLADEWAALEDGPGSLRQTAREYYEAHATNLAAAAIMRGWEEREKNPGLDWPATFDKHLQEVTEERSGPLVLVHGDHIARITLEEHQPVTMPLKEIRTGLSLEALLQHALETQQAEAAPSTQVDPSLTADNLPVPSNQIVNMMLQGVWRAGDDWQTNGFWSYNDAHLTARAQHQPQKGGLITLDVQHSHTGPQEALAHVDKYLRSLSTETADIALLFLAKLGQAKNPLGNDPIQITAAEIRHAKGLQSLRGKKRQEFDDRIAEHVSNLSQLSFNMIGVRVQDPDHEGKGSAWKAQSWQDRLFDIATLKEEQGGLYADQADTSVTYTWSVRVGHWAHYFLNPEARRWVTNMAGALFELSHREDRKVEQLAKKIGQTISLDSWKPGKGQPITYKHRTLLEKIGENPANSSKPGRLADQYQAALQVLNETEDFQYSVAYAPQQDKRTRGWANRFLEEKVTFEPRNQIEALPASRPARKAKKKAIAPVQEDLGQRIRDYREAQDLNQDTAARLIGISRRYLSDLENGKRVPSKKVAEAALAWLKG